jgi:hypothetical protein
VQDAVKRQWMYALPPSRAFSPASAVYFTRQLAVDARGHISKASFAIIPRAPPSALSHQAAPAVTFEIAVDGGDEIKFSSKDLIAVEEGGGGGKDVSSILLHLSHLAAAATAAAAAAAAPKLPPALSLARVAQAQGLGGGWPLGIRVHRSFMLGGGAIDVMAFVSVGAGSGGGDLRTCIILCPPVPCSLDTLHALRLLPPPPPPPLPPPSPLLSLPCASAAAASPSSSSSISWGELVIRE